MTQKDRNLKQNNKRWRKADDEDKAKRNQAHTIGSPIKRYSEQLYTLEFYKQVTFYPFRKVYSARVYLLPGQHGLLYREFGNPQARYKRMPAWVEGLIKGGNPLSYDTDNQNVVPVSDMSKAKQVAIKRIKELIAQEKIVIPHNNEPETVKRLSDAEDALVYALQKFKSKLNEVEF